MTNQRAQTSKTIVVLATLDTKGTEADYLRKEIERRGHKTIVIDTGVLDEPKAKADITRQQVAQAGGRSLQELVEAAEEGAERLRATQVIMKGVANIAQELHSDGKLDGVVSLGGSTGTAVGVAAMKALPIGVPKLAVATSFWPQYLGEADLTIMQTPADLMGLNILMRRILSNAAGAIVGMVETEPPEEERKPLVGITAMGVTTPAVLNMQPLLYAEGFETIVFHAKSEVLDQLVEEDIISGVIDLNSFEFIRIFIYPGVREREGRLDSTLRKGIPLVIVPGGLDMIVLRCSVEEIPSQLSDRKVYRHGPYVTAIRTTGEEIARVARIIAEKANQSRGPVAIVIPLQGFSSVDRGGQEFYAPEIDAVFIHEVKKTVKKEIKVVEVDAHINDERFAKQTIGVFRECEGG